MSKPSYQVLRQELDLTTAMKWFQEDVKDDFYPDPILYADLAKFSADYVERRQHRLLQLDTFSFWREFVPKRSRMLREAVCLHPVHRILYLAILRRFLPRLDVNLSRSVYSHRLADPADLSAFPFTNSVGRWQQFINDFRRAALEGDTIVVTDLASFFDHINCDRLLLVIRSVLGTTTDEDEAFLVLLKQLLDLWSEEGYGIPQSMAPSSFFGSLFLHGVDQEMSRRYRYFRYVDDIRIVASSEEEAVCALHDLQREMGRYRQFLASDKTRIIRRETSEFKSLLDAEDDKIIGEIEREIASGNCSRIQKAANRAFERMTFHASPVGDDRKFRAYINRMLMAGDYIVLADQIHEPMVDFVISRLRSYPHQSDFWVKVLAAHPNQKVVDAVEDLLVHRPTVFEWQKYHLWKLVMYLATPLSNLLFQEAINQCAYHKSEPVAAQAILCVGKHGSNADREALFKYFTPQRSYPVQRAVLIAIQELPVEVRHRFYARALQINSDHHELVDFLTASDEPLYGTTHRDQKQCVDEPEVKKLEPEVLDGIGLINGEVMQFPISHSDYSLEPY